MVWPSAFNNLRVPLTAVSVASIQNDSLETQVVPIIIVSERVHGKYDAAHSKDLKSVVFSSVTSRVCQRKAYSFKFVDSLKISTDEISFHILCNLLLLPFDSCVSVKSNRRPVLPPGVTIVCSGFSVKHTEAAWWSWNYNVRKGERSMSMTTSEPLVE